MDKKSAREYDTNGWYEVKNNPLSLVGVFPYLGRSIGAPEPDRIYYVWRPAEELAHPDCINSFKLLPWVDEHTMLGAEGSGFEAAEEKGVQGVIGEDVYFRDNTLYGNIKVFSNALAGLIESGKKELSCGYRCTYEQAAGIYAGMPYDYVQRNIRGNHLALVQAGRMGKEVAVLDHFVFTVDSREFEMGTENTGGESVDLAAVVKQLEAIAPQVQQLMSFMAKLKPMEEAEHGQVLDTGTAAAAAGGEAGAGGGAAAAAAEPKAEDDEAGAAGMDAAIKDLQTKFQSAMDTIADLKANGVKAAMGEIAKRDALAAKVAQHVGTFDHASMTTAEVAKYGCDKLSITCDSGAELATLQGYLAAAKPATTAVALDHAPRSSELDAYLNNK